MLSRSCLAWARPPTCTQSQQPVEEGGVRDRTGESRWMGQGPGSRASSAVFSPLAGRQAGASSRLSANSLCPDCGLLAGRRPSQQLNRIHIHERPLSLPEGPARRPAECDHCIF